MLILLLKHSLLKTTVYFIYLNSEKSDERATALFKFRRIFRQIHRRCVVRRCTSANTVDVNIPVFYFGACAGIFRWSFLTNDIFPKTDMNFPTNRHDFSHILTWFFEEEKNPPWELNLWPSVLGYSCCIVSAVTSHFEIREKILGFGSIQFNIVRIKLGEDN